LEKTSIEILFELGYFLVWKTPPCYVMINSWKKPSIQLLFEFRDHFKIMPQSTLFCVLGRGWRVLEAIKYQETRGGDKHDKHLPQAHPTNT
jgi:hypothetical protein